MHEALLFAERSVALDDTDARPHTVLAWACMFRREFDRSRRHFDLSASLSPNDADLIMQRAGGYVTTKWYSRHRQQAVTLTHLRLRGEQRRPRILVVIRMHGTMLMI